MTIASVDGHKKTDSTRNSEIPSNTITQISLVETLVCNKGGRREGSGRLWKALEGSRVQNSQGQQAQHSFGEQNMLSCSATSHVKSHGDPMFPAVITHEPKLIP